MLPRAVAKPRRHEAWEPQAWQHFRRAEDLLARASSDAGSAEWPFSAIA